MGIVGRLKRSRRHRSVNAKLSRRHEKCVSRIQRSLSLDLLKAPYRSPHGDPQEDLSKATWGHCYVAAEAASTCSHVTPASCRS